MIKKTYIYRITHLKNIPHILEYGITHRSSKNMNPSYFPIGDSSLISKRDVKQTPFDTLIGDYIPFYFCCKSPMMYVIQNGYNDVPIQKANNLVYCVSSVQEVLKSQIPFIYTDGHATDRLSTFYDSSEVHKLYEQLDFDAIDVEYWKSDEDLDLKRRKEAELLISADLPPENILGYIVHDDYTERKMLGFGCKAKIHIDPKRYF